MPAITSYVLTDPADVQKPALGSGKMHYFIGLDNIARGRDENDVLHLFDPSVSSAIGNVGTPVDVIGGAAPTAAGQVLITTAVDAAEFRDARVELVSTPYLTKRGEVNSAELVAIDEYLRVNLATASADVPITLPPATAGLVDRELLVKINSLGFPDNNRKVVLVPDGADTVDGLASGGGGHLEMLTNFEWRILRVAAVNKWEVVG